MVNTFLNDKKMDIGSLLSVKCAFTKFTDYETKIIPELEQTITPEGKKIVKHDVEVIAGVPPVKKNRKPTISFAGFVIDHIYEATLSKDIFFEVLALTKNIKPSDYFNEQNAELIPTEGILNLCRKYGIVSENKDLWMQHRIIGFDLQQFKYLLFKLRWIFTVYMAVEYEDFDLMRDLIPSTYIAEKDKKNDQLILKAAKEWILLHTQKASFSLCMKDKGFGLEVQALDILNACYIFLSFLIVTGDNRNIKICANTDCQDFFLGHGNKKYCDKCNRKTLWSRNKRANEDKKKKVKR